ncbi:tetratricopeptide repeat protein [Nannocystis pusilla]|uniref:tetratricopeptide repeat protein n=1 Tax=Nannocystis pusilla TaxID=889268 RepID=UPI003B75ED71
MIAALRIDPDSEQRWHLLAAWSNAAGEREGALAAAQALAEARPGSAWTRYGLGLLLPDEDLEGTLAQLAEAVRLDPLLVRAHDARAELLAGAKRWEEALAACAPPGLPEPLPLALRGRRAWIDERRGDVPEAVEQMQALVAEEPDYWFGWLCLANWAPKVSQRALARQSLGELLRLDPSRGDVATALFEAELAAQDFEAAERTLARLRELGEDDVYRDAALSLAFARGRGEGIVLFERLACTPGVPEGWLLRAAGEVGQRVWQSHFNDMTERLLVAPGASPVVGYLWGRFFEGSFFDWLMIGRRLRALRERGAIGIEATAGHVERLALSGQRTSLALFVWFERSTLRAHDRLWASAGYALLVVGWFGRARAWLADWQQREGLEPWMLRHVVTALRGAGQDAEARLASERALASPVTRDAPRHRTWLALDAAREGSVDAAKAALAAAPVTAESEPFTRWLHARVQSLVARQDPELPPERRREKAKVLALESETHELEGIDARLAARLRRRLERAIA